MRIYCIIAKDSLDKMGGNRGKMCAQTGHAFLHSFWDAEVNHPATALAYKHSGMAKKVTLIAPSVEDLRALYLAYGSKCGVSLVTDAGLTVFKEPTTTCLGIGPIYPDDVGEDLKALKVFL